MLADAAAVARRAYAVRFCAYGTVVQQFANARQHTVIYALRVRVLHAQNNTYVDHHHRQFLAYVIRSNDAVILAGAHGCYIYSARVSTAKSGNNQKNTPTTTGNRAQLFTNANWNSRL